MPSFKLLPSSAVVLLLVATSCSTGEAPVPGEASAGPQSSSEQRRVDPRAPLGRGDATWEDEAIPLVSSDPGGVISSLNITPGPTAVGEFGEHQLLLSDTPRQVAVLLWGNSCVPPVAVSATADPRTISLVVDAFPNIRGSKDPQCHDLWTPWLLTITLKEPREQVLVQIVDRDD